MLAVADREVYRWIAPTGVESQPYRVERVVEAASGEVAVLTMRETIARGVEGHVELTARQLDADEGARMYRAQCAGEARVAAIVEQLHRTHMARFAAKQAATN